MRRRRWAIAVIISLVGLSIPGWWYWRQCRPHEHSAVADVSWLSRGKPRVVDVTVADARGLPLAGVNVQVLNDSGGDSGTTDAAGRVSIGPLGEREFTGLRLNGVNVVNRPYANVLPGSPNVENGLQVKVVVIEKAAFGINK